MRQQLPQEFWAGQVGEAHMPGAPGQDPYHKVTLTSGPGRLRWALLASWVWAARRNWLVLPSASTGTDLKPLLSCCFAY